jgi:pyruvate dehydrogenase E1 component subunit alpha
MTIARRETATTADSLSTHHGFSLISNEKLLQLYSIMLQCSMLDERIRVLSKRNRLNADSNSAGGHIAAIAGVAIDLHPRDTLAPSCGAFVHCFVKGLPLAAIFASLSGHRIRTRPSYASLNLIPPSFSFAAQLDRALCAAATCKTGKNKKIVVVFCGDSSVSSSDFESAMAHAGRKNLPILFVCQTGPDAADVALRAQNHDLPGVTVDGEDAVAVYRVATEAIAHARRGSGPTLIECKPWPLSGRKSGSRRAAGCAVRNMETYLARKGLFSRRIKSQVTAEFRRELDAAIKASGAKSRATGD